MEFTDKTCPVCGQRFTETDDVVVCPDCGTAHHRACYQSLGRCAFADKHGTDVPSQTAAPQEPLPEEPAVSDADRADDGLPDTGLFADLSGKTLSDVTLDGVSGQMFYDAIGKKQEYYMPRFVLLSRMGNARIWNFFAFLCPGAWSLYRKMYKWAAVFFAALFVLMLLLAVPVFTNTAVRSSFAALSRPYYAAVTAEEQRQYADDLSAAILFDRVENAQLTASQQQLYNDWTALNDAIARVQSTTAYVVFYYAAYVLMFAAHVVFALRATKLYYGHLGRRLKMLREVTPPERLTADFIRRKTGVLPLWLAVLVGILEFRLFL